MQVITILLYFFAYNLHKYSPDSGQGYIYANLPRLVAIKNKIFYL